MATEGFRRRLSATLSADVKEYSRLYSRLMRDDEDATIRTLTTYRSAIAKLVQQYRGRVVDSPGDNVLAEFGSVVDAVNCAVEIQRDLAERNAELPYHRRMEFRIGVNSGDVVEEGERIYGDGVNIAARVEGLAEGGGICISGAVYDSIEGKLGLEFEDLGEHEVKNIDKPIRVYRVLSFPGAAAHRVVKAKSATERKWLRVALVIAAVVVLGAGALAIWNFFLRPTPPSVEPASVEKMAFPLPDKPSIAVLPFVNLSDDPKQEFLSDGLTEQIITGLSKVPYLFVIARNSVFTYKDKPVKVQQVSEELGVRYVLEGSVQKAADRVRITVQLIDATKGHHLWSERYDRHLKDIFAIQDEITLKIMKAMRIELTDGEEARKWVKHSTENLEAYEKYLQGDYYAIRNTKQDIAKGRELLNEAIALDPNFALAYATLGWTHFWDARYGWSESRGESIKTAFELAQKALALDDKMDIALMLLATIHFIKREWEKGMSVAEQALAISPNSAGSLIVLGGLVSCSGRWEESIPLYEKGIRLDPFPPVFYFYFLGRAYMMAGRYEEAIETFKKAVCVNPDYLQSHTGLAATYSLQGRGAEARTAAAEVLRIQPKFSLESFGKTLPFENQADIDLYINALRKAGLPETPPLPLPDKPSIAVLPFTNMSDDPKQKYFVDGMTEDLITDLSKISGLFVIARNSVFQYRGKPMDVKKISRELGVRYLLEGSVRRANNQIRINAQLIDSSTGGHLWAERYDGEMDDIFALQDKINQKIVAALAVRLTADEKEEISRKYTDNPAAYDALLKGMEHYHRFTAEDFAKAATYFEKAIELDPDYGRAYAALAAVYWWGAERRWVSSYLRVSYFEALLRPRRYMQMAKKNPSPTMHRVAVDMLLRKRLHKEAIAEAERALALDPNNAESHRTMARALIFDGRPEEALDFMKTAMRLDPLYPATYLWDLGLAYSCMAQYEKAVTSLERAITLNPKPHQFSGVLAATYAHLGRDDQARKALEKFRGIFPIDLGDLMYRHPFKDPETAERFASGFLKAGMPGRPFGYYKIYEENKLAGEEIRELVFGQKVSIALPHIYFSRVTRTIDGKATLETVPASGRGRSWRGNSWIEGDMLCDKWEETQPHFGGFEWCGTVFRNPEYKSGMFDEYLWATDYDQALKFSLVE